MKKLTVRVKPGSKRGSLVEVDSSGLLIVCVRQPAVGGKANEAVIKILAKHLGVTKSRLSIIGGRTSKTKIIEVQ